MWIGGHDAVAADIGDATDDVDDDDDDDGDDDADDCNDEDGAYADDYSFADCLLASGL